MSARVPMDVDLEDRLVYGLTPQRFGYVAVAALAAIACWHTVPVIGGPVALVVLAVGAALGWGRWAGSGVDHWALAAGAWLVRTHRLEVDRRFVPYAVARIADVRLPSIRRDTGPDPTLPRILRRPPKVRRLHVITRSEADP